MFSKLLLESVPQHAFAALCIEQRRQFQVVPMLLGRKCSHEQHISPAERIMWHFGIALASPLIFQRLLLFSLIHPSIVPPSLPSFNLSSFLYSYIPSLRIPLLLFLSPFFSLPFTDFIYVHCVLTFPVIYCLLCHHNPMGARLPIGPRTGQGRLIAWYMRTVTTLGCFSAFHFIIYCIIRFTLERMWDSYKQMGRRKQMI